MKTVFVAAAALIDPDRRILLAQRPLGKAMGGLWEFPGGKVEPGELPEAALIRELHEELGIETCASCLSAGPFVSHAYTNEPPKEEPGCGCPVDTANFIPAHAMGLKEEFHLLMVLYLCRKWEGIPHAREGQTLAWRTLAEMCSLPMPPADVPLVGTLRGMIG
jgi:8-oxo-dGTP diphosphatase